MDINQANYDFMMGGRKNGNWAYGLIPDKYLDKWYNGEQVINWYWEEHDDDMNKYVIVNQSQQLKDSKKSQKPIKDLKRSQNQGNWHWEVDLKKWGNQFHPQLQPQHQPQPQTRHQPQHQTRHQPQLQPRHRFQHQQKQWYCGKESKKERQKSKKANMKFKSELECKSEMECNSELECKSEMEWESEGDYIHVDSAGNVDC